MDGKATQTQGQRWKKRWSDYCSTLKTMEALNEAWETARASASAQLEEVRKLVEDEMRGPAPTGTELSRNSGGTHVQRRLPCSFVPLPPKQQSQRPA